MMSVARLLLILTGGLLLAGCEGDNPQIVKDTTPGETSTGETGNETAGGEISGTRLRARYTVGADGSREFVGWFDTVRGEDCSFKQGDEGRLRCLPAAHPVIDFSDPDCTVPLVTLPPQLDCNGKPPKYVMAMDFSDACMPQARLFELGAATQTTVDPVYRSTAQGCMPLGSGAMPVFFEIGPEVPMTEMVEGSTVTE